MMDNGRNHARPIQDEFNADPRVAYSECAALYEQERLRQETEDSDNLATSVEDGPVLTIQPLSEPELGYSTLETLSAFGIRVFG